MEQDVVAVFLPDLHPPAAAAAAQPAQGTARLFAAAAEATNEEQRCLRQGQQLAHEL